jgi:hypothetical protein
MFLDKVIIWGLRNSTHTHSYIHAAFYKAFKELKYEIYWINDITEYKKNITNALIIYSGPLSDNKTPPPIISSCFYLLHNYTLNTENKLHFQVYTTDCINRDTASSLKYHYYNKELNCIYFPWATNILPDEINENIQKLNEINENNDNACYHIGSLTGEWLEPWIKFARGLQNHNILFKHYQPGTVSDEENIDLIKKSLFAPALQFKWQINKEYIPCRIFKNISYGKMGITNNEAVNKLFNNKLLYDNNIDNLVNKCLDFNEQSLNIKNNKIVELMYIIRDNHTYISRINYILKYLKEWYNIQLINI